MFADQVSVSEYGVLRLISKAPEKTCALLKEAGFTARLDGIIAVVVPDAPGSLQKVLLLLHEAGINISYIYGLSVDGPGAPIAIKTDDQEKAAAVLEGNGVKILIPADLGIGA